ncbi:MAG TPA: efflux RND transporter periplasmic adaptor subunit [Lacunisphaera sp.]|jgi:multidrug efflux system membrane fusion protein
MNPRCSHLISFITALALLGLLAGCDHGPVVPKTAAAPAVPVQVAVALQQDVPRRIDSIGSVQALRSVSVKSQVDGIIAQVHFQEGQEVKAGDPLVTLDRRPFENAVQQARAAVATAQAEAKQATVDAERYSHLDQQSAISKEAYAQYQTKAETTKADVQSKDAALANAELQLGYTEIKAPIAGRTGQLQLHEGALVKANDNSFTIVNLNQLTPIAVAYSVPEDSLSQIRAALAAAQVRVTVVDRAANLNLTNGRLTFMDNSVDPTTGTIVLKAIYENIDHALWPGQFVQVHTEMGVDRGVIVVPTSAVQTGQDNAQIYVVKPDHTVDLRTVEVLRTVDDITLLSSGVKAGETVVTDGQLRLLPGVKVEAKTLDQVNPAVKK